MGKPPDANVGDSASELERPAFLATRPGSCYRLRMRRRPAAYLALGAPAPPTILGHPAGLFLLFLVEMWERFSYYGMRGLLVLYLVQAVAPAPDAAGFVNPGRGWSRGDSSLLYGWYTGLAYLTPIVGGWIADRLLGTHRSMVVGGLLIALGHLVLAVSGVGSLARTDAGKFGRAS